MKRFRGLWCVVLLLLMLVACSSKVELMSAVPEDEANDIMSTLLNAGITVDKSAGKAGVTLTVNTTQVSHALDVMRAHGLPRVRFTGMGTVFRKEGLVSSALEERARYVFALSQELGETISQIDGVVSARVHVVLPERGNINESSTQATASVFIKHKMGISLDALQPQIRKMVANGIPGLEPEHVTVFMVAAQTTPDVAEVRWSDVMGIRVSPESAASLWSVVACFIGLAILLAGPLSFLGWRNLKGKREHKPPEKGGEKRADGTRDNAPRERREPRDARERRDAPGNTT